MLRVYVSFPGGSEHSKVGDLKLLANELVDGAPLAPLSQCGAVEGIRSFFGAIHATTVIAPLFRISSGMCSRFRQHGAHLLPSFQRATQ